MSESDLRHFMVMQGTGACVEAPVLVSPVPFSARYDLDRKTGVFSREGHPLRGLAIAGHILVAPGVQGGVAAGWALPAMARLGICFAGLLLGSTNPVMVQGAVRAGIPIAAGFDPKLIECLRNGDVIRLDPPKRRVTLVSGLERGTTMRACAT